MSWFDAAGFATLAKSALNSAQKTLDKALDIKEDYINPSTSRRPDGDSFFEAFGLGSKSPVVEIPRPSPVKSRTPQVGSQNSGFWTDTWESFFDTKVPAPEPQLISKTSESNSPASSPKKPSFVKQDQPTVSCQPQRASLFPGDVKSAADDQSSSPDVGKQSQDIAMEPSDSLLPPPVCPSTVVSDAPITHPPVSLEKNASINRIEKIEAIVEQEVEDTCVPSSEKDVKPLEKDHHDGKNLEIHDQSIPEKKEEEVDDISLQDDSPDSETPSQSSQLETKMSDSYVNIEDSIMSKSAFTRVSSNESSPAKRSKQSNDDVHSTLVTQIVNRPPGDIPAEFSDSFQVFNESILQHESIWVMEDISSVCHPAKNSSKETDSSSSSSKDECEIDIKDCEEKSSGSGHSRESTHSFVKCSLEDVEDGCHRGQSPLSTTASERSDMTKLESEQNTSGDENETTTSSDIEVLSPPNGENGDRNLSPMKHIWIPRTIRLRRSQSPSTDSSSMVTSINEDKDFTIKDFEGLDLDKMFQQQEDLQTLLEAREKKIMELSTENLKFRETEEKLQNQVSELKLGIARELQSTSNITKDLTQRLALTEERTQKAVKERDGFKKHLDAIQSEIAQRVSITHMEEIVKEKDQQIKELMEEGEKLSKKELQHLTIIKKLRAKEEESEHNLKSVREKFEENTKEVERLRKSLGAKDEQEKKHIEAIRHLTSTTSKQEKEMSILKSHLEDSEEKELGTRKSLESTFKELTDLKKQCELKDKEINNLQLSIEMALKEKLRENLDLVNREKESMLTQMDELRGSLKRFDDTANLREKSLKEEIFRLQSALQDAEARNDELTKNISSSTRPLVRQIETLQASHNAQMISCEKVEKNLTDKLRDVQNQLALSTAKEKLVADRLLEANSKVLKLEADNNTLHQEKIELSSKVEVLNTKCDILEENTNKNIMSSDSLKHNFTSELNKLKDDKDRISKELENCLQLLKEERISNQNLQQELNSKETKNENISPNLSVRSSLRSSVESINNWSQEDNYEKKINSQLNRYRLSVYDSLSKTGCTTSILENLQSQLKQREGEISQLQSEISKLELERESVAQELVDVSTQNEELKEKLDKLKNVEKLHKDLSQKYTALLQMYNEKVEEYEALQLDLTDVKSAYRRQIEELLQK